jgi:hypothetical protein
MIDVGILIQMVNAVRIKGRCTALNAVHDITLFKQELGEVRAVLASNTGDEGDFLFVGH